MVSAGYPDNTKPTPTSGESRPSPSLARSRFSMSQVDFPRARAISEVQGVGPADAQWLAAMRAKARKMYLQATHPRIPRARSRSERCQIDSGDEAEAGDEYEDEGDDELIDGEAAALAEDETAASATNMDSLLVKPALKLETALLSASSSAWSGDSGEDWEGDSDSDSTSPPSSTSSVSSLASSATSVAEGDQQEQEQSLDCHTQRAMEERMRKLEDQNALLEWYAVHSKGDPAASASPSDMAAVLKAAETAVFKAAAEVLNKAVGILEKIPHSETASSA